MNYSVDYKATFISYIKRKSENNRIIISDLLEKQY